MKKRYNHIVRYVFAMVVCLIAASCNGKHEAKTEAKENLKAKEQLQGVWINEEGEDAAFKAKGDSIFYPDSTSMPVRFSVVGDTFVIEGANVMKYPVVKQTEHLFVFKNQNGDVVRLVKSIDPSMDTMFTHEQPKVLNVKPSFDISERSAYFKLIVIRPSNDIFTITI